MRGYADTAVGQIHYVAEGDGVPVVLVPQAGRSSRMFADLVPLLSPSCRVVAIDPPGFGSSAPLPAGTTIEDIADCVGQVVAQLGLAPAHVYGLHTGNKIAAALAVRSPDIVASVVVSGQSHSIIPSREDRAAAIRSIVERDIGEREDDLTSRAEGWAATFRKLTDLWWSTDLVAGGLGGASLRRARNRTLDLLTADGVRELYEANFAYDLGRDLARIEVPILIIEIATAGEDAEIGRQEPALRRLCPRAVFETIEEPDGPSTLEGREDDLAKILMKFVVDGHTGCSS